jgi:predicted metal-dependent phosphoesterase TrpH
VTALARGSAALFVAGLVLGTLLASSPPPRAPLTTRDGEQVLEADFHVHGYFGDGALPPWDLLSEARRNGLHVFALTNHNQTFAARAAHWFAQRAGAPIVLVGQEVTAPDYHMVAAGIRSTVDWRPGARAVVDAIHAQGGRAIAAHPVARYRPGLEAALGSLDGAEAWHPLVYSRSDGREELREFQARLRATGRPTAAVGSTDFHVTTALGLCRTFVFVREATEAGVLEALGAGRTVVVDDVGQAYGDPERARFLRDSGAPEQSAERLRRTPLERTAVLAAWLGVLGLVVFRRAPDSGEDGA